MAPNRGAEAQDLGLRWGRGPRPPTGPRPRTRLGRSRGVPKQDYYLTCLSYFRPSSLRTSDEPPGGRPTRPGTPAVVDGHQPRRRTRHHRPGRPDSLPCDTSSSSEGVAVRDVSLGCESQYCRPPFKGLGPLGRKRVFCQRLMVDTRSGPLRDLRQSLSGQGLGPPPPPDPPSVHRARSRSPTSLRRP